MDPQFQELASEIANAVEKRLSGAFEERIKTHVEEAVDKRLPRDFEERITNNIEERLSGAFEQRIKTHINLFEQRAGLRMQMHFENLETKVTLAADGYGATLKKIERELVDLNKKVDEKFADHDLVLTDHNRRNNRA